MWAVQLALQRSHHLVPHPLNGFKEHRALLHTTWGICCITPCCQLLLVVVVPLLPAEDASPDALLWDDVTLCSQ